MNNKRPKLGRETKLNFIETKMKQSVDEYKYHDHGKGNLEIPSPLKKKRRTNSSRGSKKRRSSVINSQMGLQIKPTLKPPSDPYGMQGSIKRESYNIKVLPLNESMNGNE